MDALLESMSWPPFVRGTRYELGLDSTGDPVAWIWLTLSDAGWSFPEVVAFQHELEDRFFDQKLPFFPHVHVRTESEERALKDAE